MRKQEVCAAQRGAIVFDSRRFANGTVFGSH